MYAGEWVYVHDTVIGSIRLCGMNGEKRIKKKNHVLRGMKGERGNK